jgi:hypothetical protein
LEYDETLRINAALRGHDPVQGYVGARLLGLPTPPGPHLIALAVDDRR